MVFLRVRDRVPVVMLLILRCLRVSRWLVLILRLLQMLLGRSSTRVWLILVCI